MDVSSKGKNRHLKAAHRNISPRQMCMTIFFSSWFVVEAHFLQVLIFARRNVSVGASGELPASFAVSKIELQEIKCWIWVQHTQFNGIVVSEYLEKQE